MAEISPFVEVVYGWPYGSSGWNTDMDQNLVKFSYLFDRNIDAIVGSLPAIDEGKAYFYTADNRLYFDVDGQRYSSPVPKWFVVTLKATGVPYQFNGTTLTTTIVNFVSSVAGQSGDVTLTKADVGLSNVDNTSDVNKPVSTAQSTAIGLKVNTSDLSNTADATKGAAIVGRGTQLVASIAALRQLLKTSASQFACTAGYYNKGDGGGGHFYYDATDTTSADNGGTIIVAADGGRWKLTYNDTLFAEQFGAVGDGVSNDAAYINTMLSVGAGKRIVLTPNKTYHLEVPLLIYSNTTLIATGATLVRGSSADNMIRNYSDGSVGVYGASSNISIIGGTWNANRSAFAANCTAIAFGHATNVLVSGATVTNVPAWHHIEVNTCQTAKILNCYFIGGAEQAGTAIEAVQIDLNVDMTQFPWFGPADSTRCIDITVEGCYFQDCGTGVGTHSFSGGVNHNNIKILNNTFKNAYYAGVSGLNWSDVRIEGNSFEAGYYGVTITTAGTSTARQHIITNNTFYNIGSTAYTGTAARAVYLSSADGTGTNRMQVIEISSNTVLDMVTVGKSTNGIHVNYSDRVLISGNIVTNTRNHGMTTFSCTGVVISNNLGTLNNQSAGSFASIEVNTCTSANTGNNTVETIRATGNVQVMVRNNIITAASGLTNTSNTSSILSENLINGTFA